MNGDIKRVAAWCGLAMVLIPACGGRSAREDGFDSSRGGTYLAPDVAASGSDASGGVTATSGAPGDAGQVASAAGDTSGVAAPMDDLTGPLAKAGPTCDAFLQMWRFRLAHSPPGTTGNLLSCSQCITGASPACPYPEHCGYAPQCIDRHCLCPQAPPITKVFCDEEPGPDLCACVSECIPDPQAPCDQEWIDYFSCVTQRCQDVCQ
jgi:hypothetical protein